MAPKKTLEDVYFELKFGHKQVGKQIKKLEKDVQLEKKKIEKAIAAGKEDIARICAENAIRKSSEITHYTRLQASMDTLASHVNSAMASGRITATVSSLVSTLGKAGALTNPEQIAMLMTRFEGQSEDLQSNISSVNTSMFNTSAGTVSQREVDRFLSEVKAESQIALDFELDSLRPSTSVAESAKNPEAPITQLSTSAEKALEERLNRLRS